jgi:transposase
VATLTVSRRADLTDAQWAVLEPLPSGQKPGRPAKWTKRQTVYGLFRRWQRDGTWRQILTGLSGRALRVGAGWAPAWWGGSRATRG